MRRYNGNVNKKLLITILVLLVVIGAGLIYVLLQKSMKVEDESPVNTVQQSSPRQADPPTVSKGTYVDFTKKDFASTQGTRLLFFHAGWCPQCRALDESIKSSELPAGVTIFKVDYDSSQSLRAEYGVTLQTTVVKVDENGNKIKSYVAYDEPTFKSVRQALLP